MKRPSRPRKTPSGLSESIHQQLNMYALVAGAAGVSFLAMAQPSEAEIVYTPVHVNIDPNTSYSVDLYAAVPLFTIHNFFRITSNFCEGYLYALPGTGSMAGIETSSLSRYLYALPRGAQIGPQLPFQGGAMVSVGGPYNYSRGSWLHATNRYMGIRFQLNGQFHYGWARMTVRTVKETCKIHATLTGYAYETIPGKFIIAGRTKEPEDAGSIGPDPASLIAPTPKCLSLGLLAVGSPALSIWRRKDSVETQRKQ